MSHHYSTIYPRPQFGFPHGDARLDYCDLYAFPKPGDPSKSILIMDVQIPYGVIAYTNAYTPASLAHVPGGQVRAYL
jgi:hypothetical protein